MTHHPLASVLYGFATKYYLNDTHDIASFAALVDVILALSSVEHVNLAEVVKPIVPAAATGRVVRMFKAFALYAILELRSTESSESESPESTASAAAAAKTSTDPKQADADAFRRGFQQVAKHIDTPVGNQVVILEALCYRIWNKRYNGTCESDSTVRDYFITFFNLPEKVTRSAHKSTRGAHKSARANKATTLPQLAELVEKLRRRQKHMRNQLRTLLATSAAPSSSSSASSAPPRTFHGAVVTFPNGETRRLSIASDNTTTPYCYQTVA